MQTQVTSYHRCEVLKVVGRIDSETVPTLRQAICDITDTGKFNLVLDMTEVSFVSSAGWWVLIDTQKNCKRSTRGELVMAGLADRIKHSLDLVGMSEYFRLYETVTDAVGQF
jgi:anti-anti-sigma factor